MPSPEVPSMNPSAEPEPEPIPFEARSMAYSMFVEGIETNREMGREVVSKVALDALALVARGIDPLSQEQQDGRIQDVEEAHAAALHEDAGRVYEEATSEDERYDAQVESERRIAAELEEKRKVEGEQQAVQEAERQARIDVAQAEVAKAHGEVPAVALELDSRRAAEVALKAAGYTEQVPMDSHVTRDNAGNLLVVHGQDVKVVKPQLDGSVSITEYGFDQRTGILTVSQRGSGALVTGNYNYVPAGQEQIHPDAKLINLPSSIARVVGFKQAIQI